MAIESGPATTDHAAPRGENGSLDLEEVLARLEPQVFGKEPSAIATTAEGQRLLADTARRQDPRLVARFKYLETRVVSEAENIRTISVARQALQLGEHLGLRELTELHDTSARILIRHGYHHAAKNQIEVARRHIELATGDDVQLVPFRQVAVWTQQADIYTSSAQGEEELRIIDKLLDQTAAVIEASSDPEIQKWAAVVARRRVEVEIVRAKLQQRDDRARRLNLRREPLAQVVEMAEPILSTTRELGWQISWQTIKLHLALAADDADQFAEILVGLRAHQAIDLPAFENLAGRVNDLVLTALARRGRHWHRLSIDPLDVASNNPLREKTLVPIARTPGTVPVLRSTGEERSG